MKYQPLVCVHGRPQSDRGLYTILGGWIELWNANRHHNWWEWEDGQALWIAVQSQSKQPFSSRKSNSAANRNCYIPCTSTPIFIVTSYTPDFSSDASFQAPKSYHRNTSDMIVISGTASPTCASPLPGEMGICGKFSVYHLKIKNHNLWCQIVCFTVHDNIQWHARALFSITLDILGILGYLVHSHVSELVHQIELQKCFWNTIRISCTKHYK